MSCRKNTRYIVSWPWGIVHPMMLTPMLAPVVNLIAERLKFDITGEVIPLPQTHYLAREALPQMQPISLLKRNSNFVGEKFVSGENEGEVMLKANSSETLGVGKMVERFVFGPGR